ncbi:MAG: PaaI family thioesterase [Deinococcota bacterium]|uniref:PaaI family thioesterase n=1 Tax=Allomeiothermus silvanus TaxID=52022 RepID=UPI002374549E|nr:PaaI family thioesterase [Allomeiothermus silvanus]MCL6568819.1 PaaI family thioesterase [Allomeiothermus silvanus]
MNRSEIQRLFTTAPFVQHVGMRLLEAGEGWCESEIEIQAHHQQQDSFIHAGVQATMADHTAGSAAATLIRPGQYVLTVEFKINLLRPAQGQRLRCKAEVLKPGKTLSIVESSLFTDKLVSKATVTLAILEK